MAQRILGATLLSAVGCAAPSLPHPPASAAPDALVQTINAMESCACEVRSATWRGPRAELSFRPGGRPFAVVTWGEPAALHLFEGGRSLLEVDAGGVVVRGYTSSTEIGLHVVRAHVFGGVLVPSTTTELHAVSASAGTVRAVLHVGAPLELVGSTATADIPCANLSLDATTSFDPAVVLRDAKALVDRRLRAGRRAALSPSLGAPPAAILAPTMDLRVTVHEERGSAARVSVWVGDVLAFGWVPIAVLGEEVGGLRSSTLANAPRVRQGRSGPAIVLACEIALFAELGGERLRVGSIGKGSRVLTERSQHPDFVSVEISGANVDAARDATLLVSIADLARCRVR